MTEAFEDRLRKLQKSTPRALNDAKSLEQADDGTLAEWMKKRAEWSKEQSEIVQQSLKTTGQLSYDLAWGTDGGVASLIAS